MDSRFKVNDHVRLPADDLVGVVITFGIGLGDNTPERLKVKISDDDVREVYASACEPVEPGEFVPETDSTVMHGDGDTLNAADDNTSPGDDSLERRGDPDAN